MGLLIGAMLPFVFSSMAMKAVGRAANAMVEEVRRQFREIKGLMEGTAEPEYGRCVTISTQGALRQMVAPGLMAVAAPVAMGLIFGKAAVGGLLAGATVSGVMMALFMANAGGAWDNAKKFIEAGHHGGKGGPVHKAAVIGDTVGDPFKDTAGPALNPLIKVMNLVSLLLLPAVINLEDNDGARYTIAAAALVVLLGAIAFSKRKSGGATGTASAPVEAAVTAGD
jgi:K(+)-stimulated pyrophosphate-energized sodium pump